jgi:hypothetical protein
MNLRKYHEMAHDRNHYPELSLRRSTNTPVHFEKSKPGRLTEAILKAKSEHWQRRRGFFLAFRPKIVIHPHYSHMTMLIYLL